MKELLDKLLQRHKYLEPTAEEELRRQVNVLYGAFTGLIGSEKMVLRASKYSALTYIHSEDPRQRLVGLQRLVYESTAYDRIPNDDEVVDVLNELESVLAEMLARQAVEERLEKKITRRMDEKQQEYVQEIKMQIISEELQDVETPQTKKKLTDLQKLDTIQLTESVMERVRPKTLQAVVGQERAVEAMQSKLASVYPQHLLLYGPPGVGKTTAARIILQEAKQLPFTPFAAEAPFIETDGTTLRWDSRDMTNPLLGSVHDPIYQGARKDLADTGIPEPKPGLVTEAHGGILFIDEIGEMDPMLLNKLLKVLEDKKVTFDSAYYDEEDPNVPAYIHKLFRDGAPADFILIGATTRDPSEINPAIRSRCAEVFFEPLVPQDIEKIVENAAKQLQVSLADGVAAKIASYTIEGRKAVNILADTYGLAVYQSGHQDSLTLTCEHVQRVAQISRLVPYVTDKASSVPAVGKVFGLGVAGYLGSALEIEAVAFPAHVPGKGYYRFNDTAGSMAKDSMFNAAAVVRSVTGKELSDYDVHINFVGGGNIDGPSAGCAVTTALISAITGTPIRQDAALTGEISVQGRVKPVGGVFEKAYGAKQAGMKSMVIPKENEKDIPADHLQLQIHPVETIQEVLAFMLVK
ncbi:ATP-dependent protease, Lon family [Megasphaera lornae]|jgi:ATP-dependent protease, lon family|uniref:endopeptidase La n=1 Tax=Megasphaera lornae TaxID=1000568 RepID=A0ABN0CYP2_9FIRM|nr:Lon family ATP-dependent protease [Megasphaera lornae]EGL39287.1 ATP-dependent protease, Lon family [Megasphaera lornae]